MKKKSIVLFAAGAFCVLFATSTVVRSQEADHAEAMDAGAMAAMMPGPMHTHLAALAGEWNVKGKYMMAPGTEWVPFEGTAKREMVMGGRHLAESFDSEFMGMPYQGSGVTGYDNLRGEYTSVWYDNSSTGTMVCTGNANDAGTEITFVGETSDAMTGETHRWVKMRHIVKGKDNTVFQSFAKTEDGDEWLSMERIYTRK